MSRSSTSYRVLIIFTGDFAGTPNRLPYWLNCFPSASATLAADTDMEIHKSEHVLEGTNGSPLPDCELHSRLKRLEMGQNELGSKLECLAIKQQEAFDVHKDTNSRLASLAELIHNVNLAGNERRAVLHDSLVHARRLFDAGHRLVGTTEIL